jgi:hypothetical protein
VAWLVQERDPDRGNGQLEAGLLAGPDVSDFFSALFFVEVFFSVLGCLVETFFFSGSWVADFLAEPVFSGAEAFEAADFLAEAVFFFSAFFSDFFSGFFSPFFSAFFSAGSLVTFFTGASFFEEAFIFVSFISVVFAFAFVEIAAFLSVFFPANSLAGSLAADFLGGVSFFVVVFLQGGISSRQVFVLQIFW